jgi:hypothetical protein
MALIGPKHRVTSNPSAIELASDPGRHTCWLRLRCSVRYDRQSLPLSGNGNRRQQRQSALLFYRAAYRRFHDREAIHHGYHWQIIT